MKVPYHLRKLPTALPAVALLSPHDDVTRLLDLCARIGTESLPRIYCVADGFLLRLAAPTATPFPGVLRLRGLSDNLLLPVDAELVPTLLDDEALALVRSRGLIFLPAGRVLAFDPNRPIALGELLTAGPVQRGDWQPLPAAPPLASVLRSIALVLPPEPDAAILDAGGEDIGVEPPRPADASSTAQAISKVQAGVGRGLLGLGQMLGLGGLAQVGAGMIQRALDRAPRMMEKLFGKQDAAMRWLLQQFQSGNLEEALRRAIPFSDDAARGGTPATEAGLPMHSLLYTLSSLLGSSGGRPAYVLGHEDLFRQLMDEYRKAAELAAQRGDYRRAAYIYGRLLRDYRAAANVLQRGGLHHDAAILLLMRVGDKQAAARAFAAAGEFDQALDLYRQLGDHLAAAELLRQLGEEDAAVAQYLRAAEILVADKGDYLAAGDLMLKKAHVRTAALDFFRAGWNIRPADNAVPCALRLAHLHADDGETHAFLALLDEADAYFVGSWEDYSAGQFYNEIARLADREPLAALRNDVRDRALQGLAYKLRQRLSGERPSGQLPSALFGSTTVWSISQGSDAQYAWKSALKRRSPAADPARTEATLLRLGHGTVTTACLAPERGALFVGFEDGQLALFYPSSSTTCRIPSSTGFLVSPIVSLAVDADGEMLVLLRGHHASPLVLMAYLIQGHGNFVAQGSLTIQPDGAWLIPTISGQNGHLVGFWDGLRLRFLEGTHLVPAGSFTLPESTAAPSCGLLLPPLDQGHLVTPCLIEGGNLWTLLPGGRPFGAESLGWLPAIPKGSTLRSFAPAWFRPEPDILELAGLTEAGVLNWSQLALEQGSFRVRGRNVCVGKDGYLAATLVRSGYVAAVARAGVDWLRCGRDKMKVVSTTRVPLPSAVACFVSQSTDELLVICQDGMLARIPLPR